MVGGHGSPGVARRSPGAEGEGLAGSPGSAETSGCLDVQYHRCSEGQSSAETSGFPDDGEGSLLSLSES
jgi:hypothetical protein